MRLPPDDPSASRRLQAAGPLLREDLRGIHDVVIVGGGPVGLLLACLLGDAGLRTLVLEKRTTLPEQSMAIGITPPSLRILERIGLAQTFVAAGVRVEECQLHGWSGYLGRVTFRDIPAEHRFVLSLPQSRTVEFLLEAAARRASVTVRCGVDVTGVSQDERGCVTTASDGLQVRSRHVVACDGSRSRVRASLPVRVRGRDYAQHFVMGDFAGDSGLGDQAHLFFKPEGSVESFPLPGGTRRWIVQTPERINEASAGFIGDRVRERTGIALDPACQLNASSFTPRWFNCDRYHHGRVILCGDAAHGMSPVGGQGMNTGFADAEFLRDVLAAALRDGFGIGQLLGGYDNCRRRAAASAIRRADWGMWLGTWRGRPLSVLRDFIIRDVLCRAPVAPHMGPFYAMLTIPNRSLRDLQLPGLGIQTA